MPDERSEERIEIQALISTIGSLRKSSSYSDISIKCQGEIFKVHRAIVFTQSKALATIAEMNGETARIDLDDEEPNMIAKMIDFLYKACYDDNRGGEDDSYPLGQTEAELECRSHAKFEANDDGKGPLVTNAKMYILGTKYDISSLKEVATRKYREMITDQWYKDTLVESAELVYASIDNNKDPLKDIIIEAIHSMHQLPQLLKRDDFVELLRKNGNMAFDILSRLSK